MLSGGANSLRSLNGVSDCLTSLMIFVLIYVSTTVPKNFALYSWAPIDDEGVRVSLLGVRSAAAALEQRW